eukprot:CAMPEP_0197563148 /NCGR_PEP_ID=MMETSP1320-20131121/28227_1 /TAXON_ID=91990 /ORGANISM="Bolidomonas sp., Strain RCC2347" /LENGTH=42 /DNA_ID= /DNA_START= /DNA_END= /DNA_ORIENTATION=
MRVSLTNKEINAAKMRMDETEKNVALAMDLSWQSDPEAPMVT